MYRRRPKGLEVFLVHPGGPFWAKKDLGVWSIPKGEYEPEESPLQAAQREFQEETGFPAQGPFEALGEIKQTSGKRVRAWAFEGDSDAGALVSNTCWIEWPPRSGKQMEIPEVDRGRWFPIAAARESIVRTQEPFLDRLAET